MTNLTSTSDLVLVAALADPAAGVPISAAPEPLRNVERQEALRRLMRHNRVSLIAARDGGAPEMRALLVCEPFASYLAAEEQAYQHVCTEYASVRAAFARAGIKDVLIKSAGTLPSFPHLSDNVDDLVPATLVPAARKALIILGYVELRNLEEPRKFFFKRFSEGQEVAAHHLHEHVGWAVSFLDEQSVLDRARPAPDDAGLLIPHPEDAFLITTAHALYENKAIKLGDLVKVRHCLRSGELDWERMREATRHKGWLDGLNVIIALFSRLDAALYGATLFPAGVCAQAERALSSGHRAYVESLFGGELVMPLRVSFRFSKMLFYAKCLHDSGRSAGGKLYDIVRHTLNGSKLKLRIHSQQGMLVTLSGPDGCGKTRHAEALVNAFNRCDMRANYVWTRSGSSRLTDLVVRAGKAVLRRPPTPAGATQEQRASGRRQMVRNPLVRAVWSGLVALDLVWQYAWRVRVPLLLGRVVVCDRYTYDAIADLASVGGNRHSIFLRLLTLCSPRPSPLPYHGDGSAVRKPKAAFVLSVPPAVAAARREGELSEDDADALSAIYAQIAREHGLTIVDNSRPFAEANDELVRNAMRSYFRYYRTVINGLLMANPDRSSE